jgi:hypothetical protein
MKRAHIPMLRDSVLAVLTLALVFLNFGHSSAVFASGGRVVVTGTSICGDPITPSAGDHFACHACRPNLALLPPRQLEVEAVCFAVADVTYAGLAAGHHVNLLPDAGNARAPPGV